MWQLTNLEPNYLVHLTKPNPPYGSNTSEEIYNGNFFLIIKDKFILPLIILNYS